VKSHVAADSIQDKRTVSYRLSRCIRLFPVLLLLSVLWLGSPTTAWSQVDTATLAGTVSDRSGAVVANAVVRVRDEATGLTMEQKVNGQGSYIFTALKIGTYTVTAEAPGFDRSIQNHVSLSIQQRLALNLTLKPGTVSETVEVSASGENLQTQEASVGLVVTQDQINNLPLNGRNFTLLAQLSPGTTTTVYDSGHGEVQSGSFTSNGVVTTFNNYLLDGITNNNMSADFGNGNSFTLLPPPDALKQFKVENGNYSAEYGRSGGAVINAVTRSGQNSFFGDIWEYNRNAYFDAEDYFLKKARQRRPKYNRNQFGGSIGGPIIIPHVYNGRDRTFFFADYSGSRIVQGQAYTSSVPTAAEQNSNFTNFSDQYSTGTQTDILGRVYQNGQIFDPATTRYIGTGQVDPITGLATTGGKAGFVRDPFTTNGSVPGAGTCSICTNVIPANRLSSVDTKLLALFPLPNTNGTNFSNNYVSAPVLTQTQDSFDVRVDQNISSKDQLFGRASYGNIPRNLPAPCPTIANCGTSATVGTEGDKIFGAALGETHIFSARIINEFRLGYNRIHMARVQPQGSTAGLNAQYGIPGIPDIAPNGGIAQIKISGLSELGEHNNTPLDEIGAETQYEDNVSLELGHHSIRFGADFEAMKNAILSAQFAHGYFSFTGGYVNIPNGATFNLGVAQFAIEPTASSVASACPTNLEQSGGTAPVCGHYDYIGGANQIQGSPISQQDYRHPYFGTYLTDTWRMKPNFTATLGLRWEYFRLGVDHAGRGANFVPGFGAPNGQAEYLIDDRSKNIPLSPSFVSLLAASNINLVYTPNHQLAILPETNFSPRVGFAWNFYPHSVLRAAYGIFYAGVYARGDGYNPGDDYPFSFGINITPGLTVGSIAADSAYNSGTGVPTYGALDKGLAAVPLTPVAAQGYQISPRGNQYFTHIPYVQEENITIQQLLSSSQSLQIGYVGTQSRHVESTIGNNKADLLLPTSVSVSPISASATCTSKLAGLVHDGGVGDTTQNASFYYDQYPCIPQNNYENWTAGSNNYNSMQVVYQKFLSGGTSLIANYTWSRLLGYGSDSGLFSSLGYRGPLIPGFNMKGEYGNLGFESENVFHAGGVWKIPFGYGRRFVPGKGLLDTLIGGWNMTGIVTYQSGQAVTVGCTVGTTSSGGCYALPNKGIEYNNARTLAHWLNSAAFSNPAPATAVGQTNFAPFGSEPAQAFGPSFHRGDLGVEKLFHLPGENVFEFRAEAFNITNHPNFGQPGTLTPNNSAFASITSTRDAPSDARELQFALKFFFGNGGQY
jgi:hypothetical protein